MYKELKSLLLLIRGEPETPLPGSSPTDNNPVDQIGSRRAVVAVVDEGPPTVIATTFQNILASLEAEGTQINEVICDDGLDNDNNGLTDSEDPHCSSSEDWNIGLKIASLANLTQTTGNLSIPLGNNTTKTIDNNSGNSTVIPISEIFTHDIRTAQFFQYMHELK